MPKTEQVSTLIQAHVDGDEVRFRTTAMQIIASDQNHISPTEWRVLTILRDLLKITPEEGEACSPWIVATRHPSKKKTQ